MPGLSVRRRRGVVPSVVSEALEGRVLMSHGPALSSPHAPPALVRDQGRSPHEGGEVAPASARWGWLSGTYWYVPAPNTPALLFAPSGPALAPVLDQTVFHITGYKNGYFWGVSVTQLGQGDPVGSSMIGSVTPEGRVLLNFTPTGGSSDPTVTQGVGQMRRERGQWTMENQMFTPPGGPFQLGHWAYMVQTRPGRPGWQSLPVAGVSVPQFVAPFEGAAPRPVGR